MKRAIFLGMLLLSVALGAQDPVEGTVTFSVKTVSTNTGFSPKHILAIWVEEGPGTFVKTLKLRADKRKQYLYTWNNKSSGNTVDAITGATLSSHTTHTVTWDCTNTSGQVVADGEYEITVEFTSEHAQGPITSITFDKTAEAVHITPADLSYFIDMDLVFTPADTSSTTTGVTPAVTGEKLFSVYPNPAKEYIEFEWNAPSEGAAEIKIYDSAMRLSAIVYSGDVVEGENRLSWSIDPSLAPGTYFAVISGTNWYSSRKIIIL